jgi:hypothetical protein
MPTPKNIFETAKNNASDFNHCNADSVYKLSVSIWACYQEISNYNIKKLTTIH